MREITVLTQPIGLKHDLIRFIKNKIKFVLSFIFKNIKNINREYGGHYAVTRSMVNGLKNLEVDFNYNPKKKKDIFETVIVLSDVKALRQVVKLKKKNKIKKLLAGPNLVIFPSDDIVIVNENIDKYIVPSQWVKDVYEKDEPRLIDKLVIWPAGIDEKYWFNQKIASKKDNQVLVYWKNGLEDFCINVENRVRNKGYNPVRVVYGEYDLKEFKNILDNSLFAVFLSYSESQGIALFESWAMNIPTLCWNPEYLVDRNKQFKVVSACPYLNDKNGVEWKNLDELDVVIKNIKEYDFSPREQIVNNYTDRKSVETFLNLCL